MISLSDPKLPSLRGEIPNVGMDSKNNGGIHLWIKGTPFIMPYKENEKDVYMISVHLTKDQVLMLATELVQRVYKNVQSTCDDIFRAINFLR